MVRPQGNSRQRKGIVDHKTLCELVGLSAIDGLRHAHNEWINDAWKQSRRDPVWTEKVAVGDEQFLEDMKTQLGPKGFHRRNGSTKDVKFLNEAGAPYKVSLLMPKLGD